MIHPALELVTSPLQSMSTKRALTSEFCLEVCIHLSSYLASCGCSSVTQSLTTCKWNTSPNGTWLRIEILDWFPFVQQFRFSSQLRNTSTFTHSFSCNFVTIEAWALVTMENVLETKFLHSSHHIQSRAGPFIIGAQSQCEVPCRLPIIE